MRKSQRALQYDQPLRQRVVIRSWYPRGSRTSFHAHPLLVELPRGSTRTVVATLHLTTQGEPLFPVRLSFARPGPDKLLRRLRDTACESPQETTSPTGSPGIRASDLLP